MADSSLDDFFAKKDKSKKKSKSKMMSVDALAKAEEPKKVKKKKEKEQPGGLGLSTTEDTSRKADDDQWEDFAEQKEVDYTGLRIHTLQVKQGEDKESAESDCEGEGGEREEGRDGTSGPWNTSTSTSTTTTAPPVAPAAVAAPPTEPEEKKENTAPKKYVPPAQRNAAASSTSASNPISRRCNKKAPNIQSEVDFPTLGGGPPVSSGAAWGGNRRYEDSGAGDIESNPGSRRGVNLSLENKFAALQD
ncbi:hypothetical protein ACOMHN_030990 [Nucella lapillus]